MPGPFEAAGVQKGPTKFGALGMGARQFTGLVTQRSPYRDGAVPYLVGKFYGGTRFDSIWDGLNCEITQRLTDARAPGSIVYNSNSFPAIDSFYPWKYIQNAAEIVRTIVDGSDGVIYDATPGQKTALFTQAINAGPARFLAVNTELFFGNQVQAKKILRSAKTWQAGGNYSVDDFIIDPAQNVQLVRANPQSATITDVEVVMAATTGGFWTVITFSGAAPVIPPGWTGSFSGLTNYVTLNGQTVPWQNISAATLSELKLTPDQIAFEIGAGAYGPALDTGTMVGLTANSAASGGAQPFWNAAVGGITTDGGVIWTNMGPAVENWGLAGTPFANPSYAGGEPFVSPTGSIRYWRPNLTIAPTFGGITYYAILDGLGNIQLATNPNSGGPDLNNGSNPPLPNFSAQVGGATMDGEITWICYGPAGPWFAGGNYGGGTNGASNTCAIVDSNGNLQLVTDLETATIAVTSVPIWNTVTGAGTTDGAVNWVCVGPGSTLWSGTYQYAMSFEGVDGTISTASPVTLVANGGLGINGAFRMLLIGGNTVDPQCKNIILWRTAQGQATLVFLDRIPNPLIGNVSAWQYEDVSADVDLNAFIPAPVAKAGDPPQASMTAPVYYLQRVWGIVDNTVVYSGGPDTITGNGNTAFPPLNEIPFPSQPIRLIPVLVQNGGLLVMTTGGIKIILGTGTASNPFYVGDYLELVSVLNYDAVSVFYNQIFCMESNGKVSSLAIEYPFNPQTGYTEVGFPIGDQFMKTTTGGQNSALFTPATSTLSWNAHSSADTGMYVSSGTGFWFRMSLINAPESGILWSPLRELEGGASAVQSVETTPGIRNLLIGPPVGTPGPILMRDTTGAGWTDDVAGTPTPYPAWDAKGVTLLCSTGQWASIKHVSAKSRNTGGPRPTVSVLFNEIQPSPQRPYIDMELTLAGNSNDPPRSRESLSVYSDRYRLAQQGQETTGDCILVKFDYGAEAFGDELLDWALYGAVHEEDEEQAAKV